MLHSISNTSDKDRSDERVLLIEQERLLDQLLDSNRSCFSRFPKPLETMFSQHRFNQNRTALKLSLALMGIMALLMVLANQVMPQFALLSASQVTFGQFLPFWVCLSLVVFFVGRPTYSPTKQLHLYLLVVINGVIYSDLSIKLGFGQTGSGMGSLVAILFMMVGQATLLLVSQTDRALGLMLAVLTLAIFNLISVMGLGTNIKDVWPVFSFANVMIVAFSFIVQWINALSEVNTRRAFLEFQQNQLKHQIHAEPNKAAQLFAVPNSHERVSKQLVSIDPRTGIANAKSFQRYMNQTWSCAYNARQCLALILVDLGHPPFVCHDSEEAEQLDRSAREEMKRFGRRDGDLVGCYDETRYGILLVNTDLQNAKMLAEKLIQHLQQLYAPYRDQFAPLAHQKNLNYGINIGVASALPMPGINAKDLAERAEQALLGAIEKKQVNAPQL